MGCQKFIYKPELHIYSSKKMKRRNGMYIYKYRYAFNGQEKDDEISGDGNSLDFGARICDSRIGRWFSVDALQAEYTGLSPYNFCANNPIIYIDKGGKEIFIFGADAQKAVAALAKTTSFKVDYNTHTGQLTVHGEFTGPLTEADQKLMDAIKDPNIRVETYTTKNDNYTDPKNIQENGEPIAIVGGAYLGSEVESVTTEDGESKKVVVTKQFIKISHFEKIATEELEGGGSVGQNVKHEILESYIGGQDDPGGSNATGQAKAHNKAMELEPTLKRMDIVYDTQSKHIFVTTQDLSKGVDLTKQSVDIGPAYQTRTQNSNPPKSVPDNGKAGGTGGKTSNYKK